MIKYSIRSLILLIAILGLFSACESSIIKDDITLIQEEIESKIMQGIDDPTSYTFVEIQVLDTTYYHQIFEELISTKEQEIQRNKERLNHEKEVLVSLEDKSGEYIDDPDVQAVLKPYKESISNYESKIHELNNYIIKANEVSSTYDDNASFLTLSYTYRANNQYGALELMEKIYEVRFNEDEIHIFWSGDKELVDQCKSPNIEVGGVLIELCISALENNARNQLRRKIEDVL